MPLFVHGFNDLCYFHTQAKVHLQSVKYSSKLKALSIILKEIIDFVLPFTERIQYDNEFPKNASAKVRIIGKSLQRWFLFF